MECFTATVKLSWRSYLVPATYLVICSAAASWVRYEIREVNTWTGHPPTFMYSMRRQRGQQWRCYYIFYLTDRIQAIILNPKFCLERLRWIVRATTHATGADDPVLVSRTEFGQASQCFQYIPKYSVMNSTNKRPESATTQTPRWV